MITETQLDFARLVVKVNDLDLEARDNLHDAVPTADRALAIKMALTAFGEMCDDNSTTANTVADLWTSMQASRNQLNTDGLGEGVTVVQDALLALCVRSRIGVGFSFMQTDYDALTGPLAAVIGPIHPEDTQAARHLKAVR